MIAICPGTQRSFRRTDDFYELVTGDVWTTLVADAGTALAKRDAAGGEVSIATGGTDNNEAEIKTTQEIFLFAVGKPLRIESRFKWTEAATNTSNVFFGLMDAIGADAMVDNGGGPKATFSGVGFYKIDGQLYWHCIASIGTTRQDVSLNTTDKGNLTGTTQSGGDGTYRRYAIEFEANSLTTARFRFFINDTLVCTIDNVDITSATEMMLGWVVKAGSANSETLILDYVEFEANR